MENIYTFISIVLFSYALDFSLDVDAQIVFNKLLCSLSNLSRVISPLKIPSPNILSFQTTEN